MPVTVTQSSERMESVKSYTLTLYALSLSFCDALKTICESIWEFESLRIGIYIFSCISAVPIAIFLLFSATILLVIVAFFSGLWAASVSTVIGFNLLFLIPASIAFALLFGTMMVAYNLYHFYTQNKQTRQSPKYRVQDGEVVHH